MPASDALVKIARQIQPELPLHAVITDRQRLRTYECDGLAAYRVTPGLVTLPENTEQVQAIVRACAEHGVPFVARGSGTGLSAGALPHAEGVLIVLSAMRHILEIDIPNECAVVEPGVFNLDVSKAAEPYGYYFAPDPSSQQVCSVGGNVAENAGGAHCLKYGFTAHHVLGVECVTADGEILQIGSKARDHPGYDLLGVLLGSEGTLGIVTKIIVRLLPKPESVRTLLAAFPSVDSGGEAVSALIARGITPAAIEMMDALAISAAEQAVSCGYPAGAGAVLIVELDGPESEVEHTFHAAQQACREFGAFEIRVAADATERAAMWKGRKSAFAAVGRISRDYIVQDGVIPRTSLATVLTKIARLSGESSSGTGAVQVANVFHAGDGNLHPLVLFDGSVPGAAEKAEDISAAILDLCLEQGGSITGEHGVGVDKVLHMPRMFTDDDLDTMQRLRCAFDPGNLCNPGKVFPTPRLCGEVPGKRQGVHPLAEAGVAEQW